MVMTATTTTTTTATATTETATAGEIIKESAAKIITKMHYNTHISGAYRKKTNCKQMKGKREKLWEKIGGGKIK